MCLKTTSWEQNIHNSLLLVDYSIFVPFNNYLPIILLQLVMDTIIITLRRDNSCFMWTGESWFSLRCHCRLGKFLLVSELSELIV